MKNVLASLVAAALSGCATPYAPQEFDFTAVPLARGIVESVQPLPGDLAAVSEAFQHEINPQPRADILVRLDDGRAITLRGAQRFEAGERVRVVAGRIERE